MHSRYGSAKGTGPTAARTRPADGDGSVFARLGRGVVRHPWRVIGLWVVAAVAVIATSPGLPTTTSESSFLPKDYESIRAVNLQDRAFPQAGHVTSNAAIIVFARTDGGKLTSANSAKVAEIAKSLRAGGGQVRGDRPLARPPPGALRRRLRSPARRVDDQRAWVQPHLSSPPTPRR